LPSSTQNNRANHDYRQHDASNNKVAVISSSHEIIELLEFAAKMT